MQKTSKNMKFFGTPRFLGEEDENIREVSITMNRLAVPEVSLEDSDIVFGFGDDHDDNNDNIDNGTPMVVNTTTGDNDIPIIVITTTGGNFAMTALRSRFSNMLRRSDLADDEVADDEVANHEMADDEMEVEEDKHEDPDAEDTYHWVDDCDCDEVYDNCNDFNRSVDYHYHPTTGPVDESDDEDTESDKKLIQPENEEGEDENEWDNELVEKEECKECAEENDDDDELEEGEIKECSCKRGHAKK